MDSTRLAHQCPAAIDLEGVTDDVTEWDQQTYLKIVSAKLTPRQEADLSKPPTVYPQQNAVVGVHWHPEFVPIELVMRRVDAMFPNRTHELVIPTQHNELLSLNGYAGVEIDCFSAGFNRKVQLLAHFAAARVERADVLKAMLAHTFQYRSSQLHEFIDSIIEPAFDQRVDHAAATTGASEDLVRFVRVHVRKIKQLIERNADVTPRDMLKNKILRNYFNALREFFDASLITHAQFFLQAAKQRVKADFSLTYFYRTEEVIEEVRRLGGAIIVPHPEQFWPILLADYDVDGIEVWNPQSREYTEFLINVVDRQNDAPHRRDRRLLITMGDDTHFGEKVIDPRHQDLSKSGRELGVQAGWDDPAIRKSLIVANSSRQILIEEYKSRLG